MQFYYLICMYMHAINISISLFTLMLNALLLFQQMFVNLTCNLEIKESEDKESLLVPHALSTGHKNWDTRYIFSINSMPFAAFIFYFFHYTPVILSTLYAPYNIKY